MRTVTGTSQRIEGPFGPVVALDQPVALRTELTGAKAAALAKAARNGLPVLPGRVLTTGAFADPAVEEELRVAWASLSEGGRRPLVVRSSSVVEDGQASSMAGMFTSVLDVGDWDVFRQAVDTVIASAALVGSPDSPARAAPMAVLMQPQLDATVGGVMFGVDPVSGRPDHLVISASEAGPAAVVGGEVDGSRYVVVGRRVVASPAGGGPLTHAQVRHLARMARHAERVFDGPQDIEWAIDVDGRLWLLQSRPVTATANVVPGRGPVLGPGPVAETFPQPLSLLEEDLWLGPLSDGLRTALGMVGATSSRRLAASPVVTSVGGRVAADLDLLGAGKSPSGLRRLDPRPALRRLVAAWRVGRLRAALPALAADLVADADRDLLALPRLEELSDEQLVGLLRRSRQALVALHGHEVLLGLLVSPGATSPTAASMALRVLAESRASGRNDDEILATHPGVLALTPPRIAGGVALPPTAFAVHPPAGGPSGASEPSAQVDQAALMREALRLRARWVQELTARAAWELGCRLQGRGILADQEQVRALHLHEVTAAVRTGLLPEEASVRQAITPGPPLPAQFRLTAGGAVVAVASSRRVHSGGGTGAGGGRGMGTVHSGDEAPPAGAVLVVRTLDPNLAYALPRLGGLVAETGSVLSHLAILARELGVPTAVGVDDAVARFPAGSLVVVDGTTGEVTVVGEPEGARA